MMEKKHPNLKILLILFLAVFVILIGLAGLKMYLDTTRTSPEMVGAKENENQSDRLTEEDLLKQLADMDQSDGTSKRMSTEDVQKQLDDLDKSDTTDGRMSADDVQKQLESLDK